MPVIPDEQLDARIAALMPELVELRHDLHAHPQLGFEETYASDRVQRALEAAGIAFESGIAETGVVGWIDNEHLRGKPAVGLRADMDALPITEETGLPYASVNDGLMHACGHDGHTTVLVGAARVLASLRDQLPRPVKLLFQPAEEFLGGAKHMVDAGVLTDRFGGYRVEQLFGLHGYHDLPLGMAATRVGPLLATSDRLDITVTGKGGHAAFPHYARDPIVAASAIVTALQTIVSREVDPGDSAVVSITKVHAGDAYNVIPPTVEMAGTIRSILPATADLLHRRVAEIARDVARSHQCEADTRVDIGYPVTRNDPNTARYAMQTARDVLGDDRVIDMPTPVMGGEDFSFYTGETAACFTFIGVKPHDRDTYPSLHHPKFDFTDDAIVVGVKLMCRWALGE